MSNERKFKWEINTTINAGRMTYALTLKYRSEIEPRLLPDEIEQFGGNVTQLELLRSGQTENLVGQKSKTQGQEESITILHDAVMGIRGIIRSSPTVTNDILKAFGVGEQLSRTVSSMIAAGNIIISAYANFTQWCNSAGVIEADITEISELVSKLSEAEQQQVNAMFTRKAKTMDKNVLQRAVEDEITKLSAIGQHVFRIKDPAVARLFEELIPNTTKTKSEAVVEPEATTSPTE